MPTQLAMETRLKVDIFGAIAGSLSLFVGVISIIGWFLHLSHLVQWTPVSPPLHFNSALMFVFLGGAMLSAISSPRRIILFWTIPSLFIALFSLYEISEQISFAFDNLFVHDFITDPGKFPGRISPNSALCGSLAATGIILILAGRKSLKCLVAAQICGSLCFAFGLTALLGYVSGVTGPYAWSNYTHMPIQSALLFSIIGKACTLTAWRVYPKSIRDHKVSILASPAWPLGLSIFSFATALSFSMFIEESNQDTLSYLPFVSFGFGCITAILAGMLAHLWIDSELRETELIAAQKKLLQEIDRRREVELELREAKEIAQDSDAAKTRFLAAVSHELRNPLGAIQGFADLLKQGELPRSEHEKFCGIISRNSAMLLEYVDELLDQQKIARGTIDLVINQVDVRRIVKDVKDLFQIQTDAKGLKFEVVIAPNVPERIVSDPKRIKQILVNLVSNAIKYTEVGFITLQLACDFSYSRPHVVFDIQDSGIGMSDEFKDRIFQAYQRDNQASKSKIAGNGLGLEISRRIAQKLGGDLELLSSRLNQGSVFRFWLEQT